VQPGLEFRMPLGGDLADITDFVIGANLALRL
jgi:hypothetical protein